MLRETAFTEGWNGLECGGMLQDAEFMSNGALSDAVQCGKHGFLWCQDLSRSKLTATGKISGN